VQCNERFSDPERVRQRLACGDEILTNGIDSLFMIDIQSSGDIGANEIMATPYKKDGICEMTYQPMGELTSPDCDGGQ